MATKQPTKKTTSKIASKNTATKARKTPATRKTTATAKAKKPTEMKSFRLYKSEVPFTQTKPTRQTVYWLIILGLITAAQLMILKIQLDIMELTQPLYM